MPHQRGDEKASETVDPKQNLYSSLASWWLYSLLRSNQMPTSHSEQPGSGRRGPRTACERRCCCRLHVLCENPRGKQVQRINLELIGNAQGKNWILLTVREGIFTERSGRKFSFTGCSRRYYLLTVLESLFSFWYGKREKTTKTDSYWPFLREGTTQTCSSLDFWRLWFFFIFFIFSFFFNIA